MKDKITRNETKFRELSRNFQSHVDIIEDQILRINNFVNKVKMTTPKTINAFFHNILSVS